MSLSESEARTYSRRGLFRVVGEKALEGTAWVVSLGVIAGVPASCVYLLAKNQESIEEGKRRALAQQEEILRIRGLLGEHEMVSLGSARDYEAQGNLKGELGGSFLIFLGSVTGNIEGNLQVKKISNIQFAWRTTTEDPRDSLVVISEIPFEKAVFKLDRESSSPTVSFDLIPKTFLNRQGQPTDLIHPNNFLAPDKLVFARFSLSPEEFSKIPTIKSPNG